MKRLLVAVFLVPFLVPVILIPTWCSIGTTVSIYQNVRCAWDYSLIFWIFVGVLVGYITMVIFGTPCIYLMWRFRRTALWEFALLGVLCSLPGIIFYDPGFEVRHLSEKRVFEYSLLLMAGLVAGILFWWIAVRSNPNWALRAVRTWGAVK